MRIKRENNKVLPVIGKIKTGIKNNNGYPMSLDYFVATGNYVDFFKEAHGEKPNNIEIYFPTNDLDQVCNERYEIRDKTGKLFAYGDGKTFNVFIKDKYVINKDEDIMKRLEKHLNANWKVHLTLRFIITKIKKVLGLWQLDTHGEQSSIPNIVNAFDTIERIGDVKKVLFDLRVEKVVSQKVGSKNKFPVISIIPKINIDMIENIPKMIGG